ncbi:hypothetical protein HY407_03650 [Candidatus Gottesmanbacteria bacterium]|nr:hypothetical protein [Candidatus Gottesmanbacteria bacterium]
MKTKKIIFNSFISLLCLIVIIFIIRGNSFAQSSIKLGSFIPGEATPTLQPTSTPTSGPTPTHNPRVTKTPTPTRKIDPSPTSGPDTCEFQYPADDIIHLHQGKDHIAIYQGWLNIHGGGPTPTQDQWAWTEAQIYEFIDKVSGDVYNRSFLYSKAVARLAMTQGFGLDRKQELHDTLSPLSCDEKKHKVAAYLESPLFLYPEESSEIKITLPGSITTAIDQKYYRRSDDGINFSLKSDTNGFITLSDGTTLDYISYDNPEISSIDSPVEGRILNRNNLSSDLQKLAQDVGLNQKETEVFVDYFYRRLPKANYYKVSFVSDEEARLVMPWKIEPTPDTEIRLLFIFKPFLDKPNIPYQVIEKVTRSGFTALDFAGIIDY